MKVLILTNKVSISNLTKKLKTVSDFYKGAIDLEFTIEKSNFENIPTVTDPNPDGNGNPFKVIEHIWYDNNISIPAKQRGFGLVCMLIAEKDWIFGGIDGYGTPNNCGVEEIVLCAYKSGTYNFMGVKLSGDKLTNLIIHEMMHRLYSHFGVEDNTHKWYLAGTPEKAIPELKPVAKLPNSVAILLRQKSSVKQTLGDIVAVNNGNIFMCKTLELSTTPNEVGDKCIPFGMYNVVWTFSPRFQKYTYELKEMPSYRIHSGNYYTNTEGCILLGDSLADINKDGILDVLNSRVTIGKFEDFFDRKPFTLLVIQSGN